MSCNLLYAAAVAEMESALTEVDEVPKPTEGGTLEDGLDGTVLLEAVELWGC